MATAIYSAEFRRQREDVWRELEELVTRVERKGLRSLGADELGRLPILYRATLSSLSVARDISLDKNLIEFLEVLSSRAYLCVYGSRERATGVLREFFAARFPQAVRAIAPHLGVATAVLVLGAAVGYAMVASDSERFYAFVPAQYAQGRDPAASTAKLREPLYHSEGVGGTLASFASFLFTHNAKIGMMCFALGFAIGIPVLFLLLTNGLILGAFAALYASRGMGGEFWAWVLPHGVTEMLALLLCAAGGLVLGQRVLFPGAYGRLRSLGRAGREAGTVVAGAVAMFFIAGLIEGIFRQTVHDVTARTAMVGATALLWIAYFALAGRGAARTEAPPREATIAGGAEKGQPS